MSVGGVGIYYNAAGHAELQLFRRASDIWQDDTTRAYICSQVADRTVERDARLALNAVQGAALYLYSDNTYQPFEGAKEQRQLWVRITNAGGGEVPLFSGE